MAKKAAADTAKMDIMPYVLILVQADDEAAESWSNETEWPALAACPPEPGDMIQPTAGDVKTLGQVHQRVHTLTPDGPVLLLIVKPVELD